MVPAPGSDDGRRPDAVMIMLITSRDTGRWVIPKGNIDPPLDPHQAAAMEAEEEAGLLGWVDLDPIGEYDYDKKQADGSTPTVRVSVYPFAVVDELAEWKEARQRTRQWFAQAEAALLVDEPGLRSIIAGFVAG
jgi:uncharacterized protein